MKFSIRKKAILMIFVFAFVLITVSTGMYARVMVNLTRKQYSERAENLAKTTAIFVDVETVEKLRDNFLSIYKTVDKKVFSDRWGEDDWNEYIANFSMLEKTDEFINIREMLRKIQDINNADCVYLGLIDVENEALIYLVDAAYEDACPIGCLDVVYDINKEILTNPARGFPAYETNTEEYGRLITAGVPIYKGDSIVAYALVDLTIEALHAEQARSVWKLYGYLFATAIIICIVGLFVLKYILVKPIKALSEASRRFANSKDKDEYVFDNLAIKTHDELQELAESMKSMEVQIKENIKELVEMNERLVASQNMASEMSELANKDALTNVGNKMAYEHYVKKLDECLKDNSNIEFGVAMFDLNSLKQINDTFGHKCGDNAIIKLSEVICKLFAHSPVFRIGGDEFVAILQNDDYENLSQLIDQFRNFMITNATNTSIPQEERISASVGYSVFDPKVDKVYSDVFNKADSEMYINKNEMKKKLKIK